MEKLSKSIWFKGSGQINCDIQNVNHSLENLGEHFVGVTSLMSGMTSVELVEQGDDHMVLKTNEGLMKRRNISMIIEAERTIVEFDEEYKAGKTITTNAHFLIEFASNASGVEHRIVISDLTAPGFMGFFYKNFGSSSMGRAFLDTYKTYLEK